MTTAADATMSAMKVDEEEDAFAVFQRPLKKKKKTVVQKKKLSIQISSMATEKAACVSPPAVSKEPQAWHDEDLHAFSSSIVAIDSERLEKELEDSLAFFKEPHEDQDPDVIASNTEKTIRKYQDMLQEIEDQTTKGRKQIEQLIQEQMRDKQASIDRSIERYRMKAAEDEKRDQARLMQLYNEKKASNQTKIENSIQLLRKRHAQENQKLVQHHREKAHQNHWTEQIATAEWNASSQRLRHKQQAQMQEFASKSAEIKNRCDHDFQVQTDKIRKQYEKRVRDIDSNRQALYSRMVNGFQQLSQRYLRRHAQKMKQKRLEVEKLLRKAQGMPVATPSKVVSDDTDESGDPKSTSARDLAKNPDKDKLELRPPSPIKTQGEWVEQSTCERSGAAARHKHRKGVLSQIAKQLSVEIHNEGVWVTIMDDKAQDENQRSSGDKNDGRDSNKTEFLPWGVKARALLESIICGEIPNEVASRFDFGEVSAVYGGHLRCVMTDLRTSDQTASLQRAEALREQEERSITDLEKKEMELAAVSAAAEKNYSKAEKESRDLTLSVELNSKDLDKAKASLQHFRNKFSRFLGPDGNPSNNTSMTDRQKLMKASNAYRAAVEKAEKRDKELRQRIPEANAQTQKYQGLLKQAQRAAAGATAALKRKKATLAAARNPRSKAKLSETAEIERAAARVSEVISSFHRVAEKRREQLNQRRSSNSSSTWVQSFPDVPGPLRKSLWHKMHRRRQQIVLRPTVESLKNGLRGNVRRYLASSPSAAKQATDVGWVNEQLLNAEKKFLLAMHPVLKNKNTSSVPPSSGTEAWAEPGWHLDLSVPKNRKPSRILPCAPSFPLLENNISEILSAPGRQAASLVTTTHLYSLASPLSTVSTLTSLAEINPGVAVSGSLETAWDANDPLREDPRAMAWGYKFSMKPAAVARSAPRTSTTASSRRRASSSRDNNPSTSPLASTRKPQSIAPTPSEASGSSRTPTSASKSERKRAAPSRSESSSSGRPTQRRRKADTATPAPAATPNRNVAPPKQQHQQQQPQPQQQQTQAESTMHQTPAKMPVYGRQQATPQMEQQPAQYSQFMNSMPAPGAAPTALQQQLLQQQQQQQRQQQHTFQMNQQQQHQMQLRLMQASPARHQVGYGQSPQGMQQMQQFFAPMPQQAFAQQPMAMPGRVMAQPGQMPMNMQGNNVRRPSQVPGDDQNDPLFMLKEM